jgi:predicted enzyme related to lactoylglutathione lyase
MVSTGPTPPRGPTEPGFINGGLIHREESVGRVPVVVIDVEDIDATLARVEAQGGRPLREKPPVGDMGFSAYFEDSEGNVVGLWETAAE